MEEKVLALYRAVIALVREGADINSMKVSDITARAGIGKGTAYEYFPSKEAIITGALVYDVQKKRNAVAQIVDGAGTFLEKLDRVFAYVGEQFHERQTFCVLMRIGVGSYEINEALRTAYKRQHETLEREELEKMAERLLRQGIEEGVIKEQKPAYLQMALRAQMFGYASYLVAQDKGKAGGITQKEARAFAIEALVKSLSNGT